MSTTPSHNGDLKPWYWSMRSDIPTAAQAVTTGTVYWNPWAQDTLTRINLNNFNFKFDYTVSSAVGQAWTITLTIGVYKMLKGRTGASATLSKIPGQLVLVWSGIGNVAKTTVYDASTAISTNSVGITPITDGLLYTAFLWTTTASGFGAVFTINKFGTTVSSGSWMYIDSGLTGQSSLPQSVAALGGGAKVDQEIWTAERVL